MIIGVQERFDVAVGAYSKVLFPTPFGPAIAIREVMSTPKSTSRKSQGYFGPYLKLTLRTDNTGGAKSGGSAKVNTTLYSLGFTISC